MMCRAEGLNPASWKKETKSFSRDHCSRKKVGDQNQKRVPVMNGAWKISWYPVHLWQWHIKGKEQCPEGKKLYWFILQWFKILNIFGFLRYSFFTGLGTFWVHQYPLIFMPPPRIREKVCLETLDVLMYFTGQKRSVDYCMTTFQRKWRLSRENHQTFPTNNGLFVENCNCRMSEIFPFLSFFLDFKQHNFNCFCVRKTCSSNGVMWANDVAGWTVVNYNKLGKP